MAILAIMHGGAITREVYEKLRPAVQWEANPAPGCVFHAAAFDASGAVHVADVWDSAEQMQHFFETRLGPELGKLGLAPPEVSIYPVHNVNAFAGIDAHKVQGQGSCRLICGSRRGRLTTVEGTSWGESTSLGVYDWELPPGAASAVIRAEHIYLDVDAIERLEFR